MDAVGPDFVPYAPAHEIAKRRYRQGSYDVKIADQSAVDLSQRLKDRTGNATSTEALAPEFNLRRTLLLRGKLATADILTGFDEAGQITDLIDCPRDRTLAAAEPYCRYLFADEGLSIDLSIDDPSQWQEIKQKLTGLLGAFELSTRH
jgi:hypothetical protein